MPSFSRIPNFSDYPCSSKKEKVFTLLFLSGLEILPDIFSNNSTEGPSGFLIDFFLEIFNNFLPEGAIWYKWHLFRTLECLVVNTVHELITVFVLYQLKQ